ncbi:unnamed protein product [Clonostachys rosea]|uniref:Uncharacterized protein n=1 Tax=Bionectria ochroleuca TaxID=29856 RepID=A0ABY6TS92_BIOOC|nr:unnamed protein product [Clonostachys rosea]
MLARGPRQQGAYAFTNDTDNPNSTGENDAVLLQKRKPDSYEIILKNTTSLSPWEHAEWASSLQNSGKKSKDYRGSGPRSWSWYGSCINRATNSGIYWATIDPATVKRLRDDPSVSSVNAIGYQGRNVSVTEAFSPNHEYMVIMDPRSGMDIWTHAKDVTGRWVSINRFEDRRQFEGATSFYDDKLKTYTGHFDPETAKTIEMDENVDDVHEAPTASLNRVNNR